MPSPEMNPHQNRSEKSHTRRNFLRVGSVAVAGGLGTGALASTADVASASQNVHDKERTPVEYDYNGDTYTIADVTSTVHGVDSVPYYDDSFILGVGFSLPTDTPPNHTPVVAHNISITCEPYGSQPTQTRVRDPEAYTQDGNGDREAQEQIIEYALDTLWNFTVGRVLPLPNPFSLMSQSGASTSRPDPYNETLLASYSDYQSVVGANWVNYMDTGRDPDDIYWWQVEASADIGFWSDTGPGTVETVTHTHNVFVEITG